MPAFGFSVGDFVSAIQLIQRICEALKAAGGASTQYQRVIIELNGLGIVLHDLNKVKPTKDDDPKYVNTLRAMVHACQLQLHDYLANLEKYDESLSLSSRKTMLQTAGRKTRWAIVMDRETEKLRVGLTANIAYITMFVQTHTHHTSHRREARRQTNHDQMVHLVQEEAEKVRLAFQQHVPLTPTSVVASNIKFTDALERYRELPYDYFRNWDVFETFLKGEFRDAPGKRQVLAGQYTISDPRGTLVTKENWSQFIFPGSEITMSVILTMLRLQIGKCPRPSCGQVSTFDGESASLMQCPSCGLRYFPPTTELKDAKGNLLLTDEPEAVLQRQAVEDLNTFGMRARPCDANELGSIHQDSLSEATNRKGAVNGGQESLFGRLSSPQTREVKEHSDPPIPALDSDNLRCLDDMETDLGTSVPNRDTLPIIDWHSGPTPMDAWLNQSAIRMDGGFVQQIGDEKLQEAEKLEQEQRDIEVLRKVHLAADLAEPDAGRLEDDVYNDLDEFARPFLRKILDKYPLIQPFLARRLAESNLSRDTRLRKSREDAELRKRLFSSPKKQDPDGHEVVGEDGDQPAEPSRPRLARSPPPLRMSARKRGQERPSNSARNKRDTKARKKDVYVWKDLT